MSAEPVAYPEPDPSSPWRDTSKITDRIPTDADLATAPPPNQDGRAVHDTNVATLVTQAAWQSREAAEPFAPDELRADRLDELEGIWDGVFAQGWTSLSRDDLLTLAAQYKRVERLIGWPTTEPSDWS